MCCQDHNFYWTSEKASTLGMTFSNNANDIEENNLIPKLNQYLQCLQHWKKHNLTLFGKICLLKTIALPKLTYPLTIFENPKSYIIKILKDSMFDFLWDGKHDKISRKVIVQNYSNGGLKMIEIESYINSLKAKWIKRLLDKQNTGQWKDLYIYELKKIGGEAFFKANIKHTDVKKLNIKSKFLSDIIEAWAKFNYKEITVENESISKQILWNNSYIKNKHDTLFYNKWFDKGVTFIEHIYDYRVKTFLSFQDFQTFFDIESKDFLKYHKLINCIPLEWKNKLKSETIVGNNNQEYLIDEIVKSKSKYNILYLRHINNLGKSIEVKPQKKWEDVFDNIDWKKTYNTIINCTIDTKIRYFQYKYLIRILPSNRFLLKCKLVNSSLCDFCAMHEETIIHLFWECSGIKLSAF